MSRHSPLQTLRVKARHPMLKLCYLPEPFKESDSSKLKKSRYLQLIWNLSPNTLSNLTTLGRGMFFLHLSSKYRLLNANTWIVAEWKSGKHQVVADKQLHSAFAATRAPPTLQHTQPLLPVLSMDQPPAAALHNRWCWKIKTSILGYQFYQKA